MKIKDRRISTLLYKAARNMMLICLLIMPFLAMANGAIIDHSVSLPATTSAATDNTTSATESSLSRTTIGTVMVGVIINTLAAFIIYLLVQIKRRKEAESALHSEKQFLRSLIDTIPDLVFYQDKYSSKTSGNTQYQTQLDKVKTDTTDLDNPHDTLFTLDTSDEINASRTSGWVDLKDGKKQYLDVIQAPYFNAHGQVQGLLAIARDFTEQHLKETELRKLAKIFHYAAEGMVITNREGYITDVNESLLTLTGWTIDDIQQKPLLSLVPEHEKSVLKMVVESLPVEKRWQGEIEIACKNHRTFTAGLMISAVTDEHDCIESYVCGFVDITELKRIQNDLKHQALHDHLTGLPNRNLLNTHLMWLIDQQARHNQRFAVLFLDIDKFKNINDSLGHHFGDRILSEVAHRISAQMKPTDIACRLGGDEFIIVLNPITGENNVQQRTKSIAEFIADPMILDDQRLSIHCSIGVSIYPDHGHSVDELIKHADSAMYHAKEKGRNTYSIYTRLLTQRARERLLLEQQVGAALENQSLDVYYQPIVDIRTGEVVKAEALLRWPLSNGQFLPPDKFVPVAEETGDILQIGEWVLVQSCRAVVRWRTQGLSINNIAVNVSKVQLGRGNIYQKVMYILDMTHCKPEWLGLEITESTIMDLEHNSLEQLEMLMALGVSISIDDFGTGQSSLSMLKRLPLTHLKVDRSFIKDTPEDTQDVEITRLIINLGHMLGVKLVAEGIETEDQLSLLHKMNCELGQGYFYSRPLPETDLEHFVIKSMKSPPILPNSDSELEPHIS